jgi:hypothetical protein
MDEMLVVCCGRVMKSIAVDCISARLCEASAKASLVFTNGRRALAAQAPGHAERRGESFNTVNTQRAQLRLIDGILARSVAAM